MRQLRAADFTTPRDGAVAWTGFEQGNKQAAQAWARANGKFTLDMTPGGKWLDGIDFYGPNSPFTELEAEHIWRAASAKFINEASGQLNAFTRGTFKDSNRIFYDLELRRARRNPSLNPKIRYRGY